MGGIIMTGQESNARRVQRCFVWAAALLFFLGSVAPQATATTLWELIEGAKKEGVLHGQWGGNSYGGAEGFPEIIAGMNKRYKLNLKGQFTPGPDMQRLMLRVIQENAAGQPGSTDVYLGNSQAIFDGEVRCAETHDLRQIY
jgi:hypothetical protein